MGEVKIVASDESDSRWEDNSPRFRVYLQGSSLASTEGWTETHDIVGADVLQVIDWAQQRAGATRTYAVALVVDEESNESWNTGRGRGLVWLLGMDGNDVLRPGSTDAKTQRRRLTRRQDPAHVPVGDKMPPGVKVEDSETA